MITDLNFGEPETNPSADEDPNTETPGDDRPTDTPPDNPSGTARERNEGQGDDPASGGS